MFEILLIIASIIQPPCASLELKLGSPKYSTREKTSVYLEKMWPISKSTLLLLARSKDIEVEHRATVLLQKCRQKDLDSLGDAPCWDWIYSNWKAGTGLDTTQYQTRHEFFYWQKNKMKQLLADETGMPVDEICEDQENLNNYHAFRLVSKYLATSAYDAGVPLPILKLWFKVGRYVDLKYQNIKP